MGVAQVVQLAVKRPPVAPATGRLDHHAPQAAQHEAAIEPVHRRRPAAPARPARELLQKSEGTAFRPHNDLLRVGRRVRIEPALLRRDHPAKLHVVVVRQHLPGPRGAARVARALAAAFLLARQPGDVEPGEARGHLDAEEALVASAVRDVLRSRQREVRVAEVEGLDELIRICRPGGVIVLTVKNTLWDAGFAERIAELEARGAISRLEETRPYASMPGEGDTVPSRCLALRVG